MLTIARLRATGRTLTVAVLAMLLIAGCGGDGEDGGGGAGDGDGTLTPIRFTFDWTCRGDWGPAMWGEELGYFEEEGVSVEFVPGTGSSDALPLIAAGEQDMGKISAQPLILGFAEDLPVKAVAVEMTQTPVVVFAEGSIEEPTDLEGKKVVTQAGQFEGAVWVAWAKATGINRENVEEIPAPGESAVLFTDHQVDAFTGFYPDLSTYTMTEERQGEETIFFVQDVLPMYGHTITVNESFLEENPDAVTAFLNAWARGMQYTMANPEATVDLILEKCPETERPSLEFSTNAFIELWESEQAQGDGLLSFTPEGWDVTKQVLVEGKLMEDTDISELYTSEHLPDPPVIPESTP